MEQPDLGVEFVSVTKLENDQPGILDDLPDVRFPSMLANSGQAENHPNWQFDSGLEVSCATTQSGILKLLQRQPRTTRRGPTSIKRWSH
jgi:hypothetical protein